MFMEYAAKVTDSELLTWLCEIEQKHFPLF